MSADIADKARELLKEDSTLLENTDLNRFTGKFSDVIKDVLDIYEKCKKKANKNNDICKISEQIEKNFGKNGEELKLDMDDRKHCFYLLFWMSDKIEECKYNFHCMNWLYEKLEIFWKSSSCCGIKEDGSCTTKFEKEFDMKVLKNKKELYRFVEYYKNISKNLKEEIT
ncbi:PIR Superfamily Protein [Plasmodium ovale curtisi]|uniref:PIR Superfamily Protein n=1 Tax=Plasmodium ovale curtisi TaxID=864141 RepID=A0A1A8XFI2_PLAOA|nr:PIR Superfamily Protein [Plasmodium ovale curtisi]